MRVRANREMTYMSRMLKVGDEFEATPIDARFLLADSSVEEVTEPPRREYRQRQAEAPEEPKGEAHEDMNVADLRKLAEERGIDLPSGYVAKPKLLKLLSGDASDDPHGEDDQD
jgi:hypothetical protein